MILASEFIWNDGSEKNKEKIKELIKRLNEVYENKYEFDVQFKAYSYSSNLIELYFEQTDIEKGIILAYGGVKKHDYIFFDVDNEELKVCDGKYYIDLLDKLREFKIDRKLDDDLDKLSEMTMRQNGLYVKMQVYADEKSKDFVSREDCSKKNAEFMAKSSACLNELKDE